MTEQEQRKRQPSCGAELYKIALMCRSKAIGRRATDPKFEDTHETYQKTWNLFAARLVKQGWQGRG